MRRCSPETAVRNGFKRGIYLEPLLGGELDLKQLQGNTPYADCYGKNVGFQSLLRLYLEYGYLRIAGVVGEGEKRVFRLLPSSSVEVKPAFESLYNHLRKNAPFDQQLSGTILNSLKTLKQPTQSIGQSPNTFDFHLVWQLYLANKNIDTTIKKGLRDVFREYEVQFFTVQQLRSSWFHKDVEVSAEDKFELESLDSVDVIIARLDILIKICKTIAAFLELKIIFGSYQQNKTAARNLLNIAWGQALRYENEETTNCTSRVFYAVVYCVDDDSNTEVLLRRGVRNNSYEELIIKNTSSNEDQFGELLQRPALRSSLRLQRMRENLIAGEPQDEEPGSADEGHDA